MFVPVTLWCCDLVRTAAELYLYESSFLFCLSFSAFLRTMLNFESIWRFWSMRLGYWWALPAVFCEGGKGDDPFSLLFFAVLSVIYYCF